MIGMVYEDVTQNIDDVPIDLGDVVFLKPKKIHDDPIKPAIKLDVANINSNPSDSVQSISDTKPYAINQPKSNTNRADLLVVKAKALEYINANCNRDIKLATKGNILWIVDDNSREIILRGTGLGNVCLNTVDRHFLQQLVIPMNYTLRFE